MIKKPMLATTVGDIKNITFPVLATPKLDGIRCIKIEGRALTRSLKSIPNNSIRSYIEANCPDGFDGEIICPNKSFNEIQSLVMSSEGIPDFEFVVFDYVKDDNLKSYCDRIADLSSIRSTPFIRHLIPVQINNLNELSLFEESCVSQGYEGVMIRSSTSPYKFGRSTLKEGYLLKIKRFLDSEAIVLDFEEQDSECLSKMDSLGMLLVMDIKTGVRFGIGTGFDSSTRQFIWRNRDEIKGKIVTYIYQEAGMKSRPRFPVFKGFRDSSDL